MAEHHYLNIVERERKEFRDVLQDLVLLKDAKERIEAGHPKPGDEVFYRSQKPLVWEKARRLLRRGITNG